MSAEQLVAELRAQLAASQAQAAARDAELAARDETLRHERQDRDSLRASLAVHQRMLAERDELLARVAEVERDRVGTQEHAALLLHAIRDAKQVPTLVDVLGIVAAAGFKTGAVPHAALNKGMWRGDTLLIGALRNFPRAKDGATRLHFVSIRGWVERITQLVVEDKAKGETTVEVVQSPLHWASQRGQLEAAQEFVRRGAKIEAKSKNGHTPLILACLRGQIEVARFLLDKGAAIKAEDGEHCYTPLLLASLRRARGITGARAARSQGRGHEHIWLDAADQGGRCV